MRSSYRVALASVVATVTDLAVLVLLVEMLQWPAAWAAWPAAFAGATGNFCVSKYWAFGGRGRPRTREMIGFVTVAAISALTSSVALRVCCGHLHWPYLPVRLAVAALLFVGWSLPAQRKWVFRATAKASDALPAR